MLAVEVKEHLKNCILPFWEKLKDDEYGGYYGMLDFDLNLDKTAEKGCILNSRIMWFFSNAAMVLKDDSIIPYAKHAYEFLKKYCYDDEFGGVYWSVDYTGKPLDTTKHTYNQAFSIYALSSYYDLTKDQEALDYAYKIYHIIEEHCHDEIGYLEAFTRDFKPESNEKLSENGVMASRTMNTLLHVMEGYAELYRVTKDEDVKEKIKGILDNVLDKVYNKKLGRQEVFFDDNWNSLIDLYSYGHDIETSWLMDLAAEEIGDKEYIEKTYAMTKVLAEKIYDIAYINHSICNEAENGVVNTTRVWWVQAEAIVGFVNAYQKSGDEKYMKAAEDIWEYIKEYVIDKRPGSEWFWSVDKDGNPNKDPIVEPWKCPYHNGRMCMEVIKRLGNK